MLARMFTARHRGGSGEPMVLLHGFTDTWRTWELVLPTLEQHADVLAPTLLGHAGGPPITGPLTPGSVADAVEQLMDEAGFETAHIVGNSAGGTLALRAALAQPERVAGLILVSPAVFAGGGAPAFVQPLLRSPQLQRIGPLIARAFLGQGDGLESRAYYDASIVTEEQRARSRLGVQVENWDRALWAFTSASQASNLTDTLAEITMPVLVVTGENDLVVPASQSIALADDLPDADLVVVPACGHLAQEECPAALLDAVNAWLAEQSW